MDSLWDYGDKKIKRSVSDQRMKGGDKDSLLIPFFKATACFFQGVQLWEKLPKWEGFVSLKSKA